MVRDKTLWLNLLSEKAPQGPTANPSSTSKLQFAPIPNVRKGRVIAIDTATGKVRWSVDRDWSNYYPGHNGIAARGDRAALLRIDTKQRIWLEAYQASTGKKVWQSQAFKPLKWQKEPSYIYRSYQLLGNSDCILLVNHNSNRLEGYDWQTGKRKFRISLEGRYLEENVVLGDSIIYYHSEDGYRERLYAFDSIAGKRLWSANLGNYLDTYIAPAVDGVYISSLDISGRGASFPSTLTIALDGRTGRKRWFKRFPDTFDRSGIAVGLRGFVTYIASSPSRQSDLFNGLQALSKERGEPLWSWQLEYSVMENTLSATEDNLFLIGRVPRGTNWRNFLFQPLWR